MKRNWMATTAVFVLSIAMQIFNTLKFIFYVPIQRLAAHLKYQHRIFIGRMPQVIREDIQMWDHYGYLNNNEWVEGLNLVAVLGWDVEKQATLVHRPVVTHLNCCVKLRTQTESPQVRIPGLDDFAASLHSPLELPTEEDLKVILEKNYLNVAMIGSCAYVFIHHKDEAIREHAFNILFNIKKHFGLETNA